MISAGSPA
ncbi:hypothetical protein YPPY47_4488, partial [Yersinia pestis PY-47]